jgi:predicted secreted protein
MQPSSLGNRPLRIVAMTAFLLTALSSSPLHAEESSWAFWGFSPDGGFAAVELFGTRGDGESPWSTFRIIDMKANQFAGSPITTCVGQGCESVKVSDPSLKDVRGWNRDRARETLAKYNIDSNIQGQRNSLVTKQRGVDQGGLSRETIQFRWLNADCTLVLQEVPAPNGKDGSGGQRMIDLRLQRPGSDLVLQKDTHVPQSRGKGVQSYGMDSMITYGNTILVVLRYARLGAKGTDLSQMFVTAAGL